MERHALMDAADWFVRLQDRKVHSGTREKFTDWLLISPDHVAAYIEVAENYGRSISGLEDAGTIEELVAAAKADTETSNVVALSTREAYASLEIQEIPIRKTKPMGRGMRMAMAAALVMFTLVLGWETVSLYAQPRYSTSVGEQRSVPLEDGSLVYLNTDSELAVDLSGTERRITLTRGEARFTVAKDPNRPFIVTTRHATVRALGTIFNVQTGGERTAVSVIEGRIVVTGQADMKSPGAAGTRETGATTEIVLSTGEQVAVTQKGHMLRDIGPPLERIMAWPNGRLVFRDEPLIDLVTDFNRYHRQPLRIADPALAGHRVNGTFDAYDRLSLIQFLERYEGVRVTTAPDGTQELTRAEPSRNTPPQ